MSEPKPAAHRGRSAWQWALLGALALSLLVNLAGTVRIFVFDSNYPFRPICHGGRHIGLVVLNEPMNKRFKEEMHYNLANSRLSRDRILYISFWEWWNEIEDLWNASRATGGAGLQPSAASHRNAIIERCWRLKRR